MIQFSLATLDQSHANCFRRKFSVLLLTFVTTPKLLRGLIPDKGTMSTRVYVGGLSYRAREKDLERFFRKYGRLREISLKNGFAFCEFEDYRYVRIRLDLRGSSGLWNYYRLTK